MPAPSTDPLLGLSRPTGADFGAVLQKVNDTTFRRVGPPAAGVVSSARGLAALYACLRQEMSDHPRLLSDDTIGQMSQIQLPAWNSGQVFLRATA